MSVVIITGSHGLVGSAVCMALARENYTVVGVDNDSRAAFFGPSGSTAATGAAVRSILGDAYEFHEFDVRDQTSWSDLLLRYGTDVTAVVHGRTAVARLERDQPRSRL